MSTADVSSSEVIITLSVTMTDESGIDSSQIPYSYIGRPGHAHYGGQWVLVSGDALNGTYESIVTLSTSVTPGDYFIDIGNWYDVWGNINRDKSSGYGADDGGITVINNPGG